MSLIVHACVGGTAVREDIRILQSGVHIVVGTPGRVYDMINRRVLNMEKVKMFVLDEADEMLSRGFKDQIYDVFKFLPEKVQVCLFSATMPMDVLEVTERFMREPIKILVKRDELTLEGIKQFYIAVEREEWKLDTLCDLCKHPHDLYPIVPTLHTKAQHDEQIHQTREHDRRDAHDHTGHHLLQHTQEGRLAHREDAIPRFHRLRYARRHGPARTGPHHEGVPLGIVACAYHDRPPRPWY